MSRKTQRYSKEFKAEAVRTVLENQLSISEGASRLSLPEGTLGQWVTAARKGLGTPGSRTVAELESEILQLRKALNEARLERDILKKAAVDSICQCNTPFIISFTARDGIGYQFDLLANGETVLRDASGEKRIKGEKDGRMLMNVGLNAEIRDNIRFGLEFEKSASGKYNVDNAVNANFRYSF